MGVPGKSSDGSDRSDGSGRSDRSDGSDRSGRSDRSDRSDGSDGSVGSGSSDRSDRSVRSDGSEAGDRSEASVGSDRSVGFPPGRPPRLRPSGGYRTLRSYQVATVIYDGTVSFCDRFLDKRSRTNDQMVQAARSGRQNIAEGSRAAATTSQTELRLVNVARASLEELLLDYEDFLRQRKLRTWAKNDAEAQAVRSVGWQKDRTDQSDRTDHKDRSDPTDRSDPVAHWNVYARWLEHADPGVVANTLICLIHQANYLLDQQISALERDFVHDGGYSEQLATARLAQRRKQDQPDRTDQSDQIPKCPLCGKLLALRTARNGPRAGSQFWGCTGYPNGKGTRPLDGSAGATGSGNATGSDGPTGSDGSVRSDRSMGSDRSVRSTGSDGSDRSDGSTKGQP